MLRCADSSKNQAELVDISRTGGRLLTGYKLRPGDFVCIQEEGIELLAAARHVQAHESQFSVGVQLLANQQWPEAIWGAAA